MNIVETTSLVNSCTPLKLGFEKFEFDSTHSLESILASTTDTGNS